MPVVLKVKRAIKTNLVFIVIRIWQFSIPAQMFSSFSSVALEKSMSASIRFMYITACYMSHYYNRISVAKTKMKILGWFLQVSSRAIIVSTWTVIGVALCCVHRRQYPTIEWSFVNIWIWFIWNSKWCLYAQSFWLAGCSLLSQKCYCKLIGWCWKQNRKRKRRQL